MFHLGVPLTLAVGGSPPRFEQIVGFFLQQIGIKILANQLHHGLPQFLITGEIEDDVQARLFQDFLDTLLDWRALGRPLRYRAERHWLSSLSYDSTGCSGSMELSPGLSEVVFGLRAEVEALKARLNKIERGQEVAVSAAYWQAVERERDSSEKKKRQLL